MVPCHLVINNIYNDNSKYGKWNKYTLYIYATVTIGKLKYYSIS